MRKLIKQMIEFFCFIPPVNKWYKQRRYYRLGLPLIFINFMFQRIFRRNARVPWGVHFTSNVTSADKIQIEEGPLAYMTYGSFAISGGCYIQGLSGIVLKEGVLWAPGVQIISSNHDMADYTKPTYHEPVVLGRKVWLGANVVILPEVNLGDNVIVAAGSVVTKSFPANVILGGSPAKIIGYRCPECGQKLDRNGEGKVTCSGCQYHSSVQELVK